MQKILYFDYIASTPICVEAKEALVKTLDMFANPSSTHRLGQKSRVVIETARNDIAEMLQCVPDNLIFTSGATEAINLGVISVCKKFGIQHIITSPLEHAAMLRTTEQTALQNNISLLHVKHNHIGQIDLNDLEQLLSAHSHALVCLMHANNEIGNLLPIKEVGKLCHKYQALFFCDMVQTVGKYPMSLSDLPVDFAVCSAHKFYGSKGCGLLYHKHNMAPLLLGGHQERNLRAGTENVGAIAAMSVALNMALKNYETEKQRIENLKNDCINLLKEKIPNICFVGNCVSGGLYNLINCYIPDVDTDVVFMQLDMAGIAISTGSACSSGTTTTSHVIQALGVPQKSMRISFGIPTQQQEIAYLIAQLEKIAKKNA